MEILIGADPEFFLRDKETGKFVSAHGMIEGTKKNPQKVKNGAVQVDGMALEFNIDPARTEDEFTSNVYSVLEQLREMVPDKYEFVFESVAHFDEEYIRNQPEVARQLGCEPDFNAYTHTANPTPDAAVNFRTASGHIHVGWTNGQDVADPEHIEACEMLAEQLDSYVGLASVVLDPFSIRRSLYGKAGAYRPKPYGMEYRTPSNRWLIRGETIRDMFSKTLKSTQDLMDGKKISRHLDAKPKAIINDNLVNLAHYDMAVYYKRPEIYNEFIGTYLSSLTEDQIKVINITSDAAYYGYNKKHYMPKATLPLTIGTAPAAPVWYNRDEKGKFVRMNGNQQKRGLRGFRAGPVGLAIAGDRGLDFLDLEVAQFNNNPAVAALDQF